MLYILDGILSLSLFLFIFGSIALCFSENLFHFHDWNKFRQLYWWIFLIKLFSRKTWKYFFGYTHYDSIEWKWYVCEPERRFTLLNVTNDFHGNWKVFLCDLSLSLFQACKRFYGCFCTEIDWHKRMFEFFIFQLIILVNQWIIDKQYLHTEFGFWQRPLRKLRS